MVIKEKCNHHSYPVTNVVRDNNNSPEKIQPHIQ